MIWEYRVIRTIHDAAAGLHTYRIQAVYPKFCAEPLTGFVGREAFINDFQTKASALTKPVIAWQDGRFVEVEEAIIKSVGEIDKQAEVGDEQVK